jgi:hypothetical protein
LWLVGGCQNPVKPILVPGEKKTRPALGADAVSSYAQGEH